MGFASDNGIACRSEVGDALVGAVLVRLGEASGGTVSIEGALRFLEDMVSGSSDELSSFQKLLK